MKFKWTQTITVEYQVNPDNYPGATTFEEMMDIDRENFTEDPSTLICTVDEGEEKVELKGEIIP